MTTPDRAVAYEVTVRLQDAADADEFAVWMRDHHIPAVMATGCFTDADLSRLDEVTFRTRYVAADESRLDDYLARHTAALRADFARAFGERAQASREIWHRIKRWP